MRLEQLKINGHSTDKLEIIVVGGTFSAYPDDYKQRFIGEIYRAVNGNAPSDPPLKLRGGRGSYLQELKKNETAKQRVVALSVETRPDWVTEAEVRLIRSLGVTKIQLGVQAIDDEIARLTKRGHGASEVARATRLLRNAGLKICYHLMPNLPGSNPQKDIEMSRLIYTDPRFKPDYVKIYPCMVIPQTELYRMWQRGEHKPYSDEELNFVLKEISALTPPFVRIDRLVRDISKKWVAAGTNVTNFRQIVERELIKEGRPCRCIRCREINSGSYEDKKSEVRKMEYETEGGRELFLSFEDGKNLFALLRLRLPDKGEKMLFPEIEGAAMIREVHAYGQVVGLSDKGKNMTQHKGLGRKLIEEAEKIAMGEGYKKMAVISAIGTHEYYRKLGYELEGLYMTKNLEV